MKFFHATAAVASVLGLTLLPTQLTEQDAARRTTVAPEFAAASGFSEGLAAVQISTNESSSGMWGFIDKTGNIVIAPKFERALAFSEGLAAVAISTNGS